MPILSNFPGGAGSGSGGVTLGTVSNINVLVASGKAYVKWTDPSDIVVSCSMGWNLACTQGRFRS